jgi:hypothetical protein
VRVLLLKVAVLLTGSYYYFKPGKTITNMQGYVGVQASSPNIDLVNDKQDTTEKSS